MLGGEHEDSPGVEVDAIQQQPPLEQSPTVEAGIRPVANFQVSPRTNFHSSRRTGRNGYKDLKDFIKQPDWTSKAARTK